MMMSIVDDPCVQPGVGAQLPGSGLQSGCFLKCIRSHRRCALNAAVRLASSRIKLGGYSEYGHRCLTGRPGSRR